MPTVEIPETRYARNGPVSIAYQTTGDGPMEMLVLAPGVSHLDYRHGYEPFEHYFDRLSAFSHVVTYDKRGCGLSDRTVQPPNIEEEVADAIAVLDAIGIEHAHLFGTLDGGAVALALAAAHPDRVAKAAVYGSLCVGVATEDFPWGPDPAEGQAAIAQVESEWGGNGMLELTAPNYTDDPALARWFNARNRAAVSPAGAATWFRNLIDVDIRPILADVMAPVLIIDRPDSQVVDPGQSVYLAAHLPNARHVTLPGEDFMPWIGDADALVDEVEEFFTGTRPTRTPTRSLATVVFTDIVDSTRQAAALGDTAWRELLGRHDDLTRHRLEDHGGQVIKFTGDGALATFDDPARAITAAQGLIADLADAGLEVRVGIHSGQIEITGDDVAGIAVHLASRISALAEPGDISVSRTVRDLLLGSAIEFDDRGAHDLKGIPGTWEVLAVVSDRAP